MKRCLVVIIVGLAVVCWGLWGMYSGEREERKRFEGNQDGLLTENREYRIRDSLNVVSTGQLILSNRELERYKGDAARLIEDLNVKLKRVESVTTGGTETVYEVRTEVRDSVVCRDVPVKVIEFKNSYLEFSGVIEDQEFRGRIVSRDTLVCVAHRVPRRIWFVRYGCKGVRMEMVCRNPYARVVYPEYVELKR